MPRFVVLQHDHPKRLHWDFMLDRGESLATWWLPMPPAIEHVLPAHLLGDHRPEYLDYEGPVSGDRGTVVRWDAGQFEWIETGGDSIVVDLWGEKLEGRVSIEADKEIAGVFRWRWSTF